MKYKYIETRPSHTNHHANLCCIVAVTKRIPLENNAIVGGYIVEKELYWINGALSPQVNHLSLKCPLNTVIHSCLWFIVLKFSYVKGCQKTIANVDCYDSN